MSLQKRSLVQPGLILSTLPSSSLILPTLSSLSCTFSLQGEREGEREGGEGGRERERERGREGREGDREREKEREGGREGGRGRERERERGRERDFGDEEDLKTQTVRGSTYCSLISKELYVVKYERQKAKGST